MGWDFLGIPNPLSQGLRIGILHFGLDQKIPGDLKSREWGSGIWDPQNPQKICSPGNGDLGFRGRKIPKKSPSKISKISLIPGMGIWDFEGEKIPDLGDEDWGFLRFLGFLSRGLGIFIPGIFAKSRGYLRNPRDIHPGDWGFLSPGVFGDGDFSAMGIYFRGMGISHQKATSAKQYAKILS